MYCTSKIVTTNNLQHLQGYKSSSTTAKQFKYNSKFRGKLEIKKFM